VIRSSNERLLLLGSEETVVPVRQTFCLAFLDTQNVAGQPLMASRKRYDDDAAGVAPLGKVVPPRVAR
jgi:hypothetical protein